MAYNKGVLARAGVDIVPASRHRLVQKTPSLVCPEINKVERILGLKYMIYLGVGGVSPKALSKKFFTQIFGNFFKSLPCLLCLVRLFITNKVLDYGKHTRETVQKG